MRTLAANARGHIFAGTNGGGVFRSIDSGDNWTQVKSGMASTIVYALALDPVTRGGYLFAGTFYGIVYRTVESTTVVRESESAYEVPSSFSLAQNYPNPIWRAATVGGRNAATMIAYELPYAVEVQLAIFDVTGRRVCTLVQQRQQAGRHVVAWDGRNERGEALASGLYIYQLRAVPSTSSASTSSAATGKAFVQARYLTLVR